MCIIERLQRNPDICLKIAMFNKSDYLILFAAFVSFVFSVVLWFSGMKVEGQYVSIWVPSILVFGLYLRAIQNRK